MGDDIVTRLHNEADYWCHDTAVRIFLEAADEIERLRERLWIWRKLADDMANRLDSSTEASDLLADYEQAVRGE